MNLQYADTHEGRVRAAADNSEEAIMRVAPEHDMPLPVQLDVDGASHKAGDTLFSLARAAAIQQLRELQVRWSVTTRAKTRITNQTLAFVRRLIGFETRMDEAAREKVTKLAASIVSAVVKGKPLDDEHKAVADAAAPLIFASQQADAPYAAYRDGLEVEMEKLARALPVYPWVKSVKGLGDKTFAQIVGEVGDFSNYSNPGKVWRRMGLAPVNGQAASTWRMKGGLTAEDWTDLGYSPSRRSLMYVVGTCLMKAGGEYKKVYDDRKVYELARQADMKPIIAHRRAQRYMEKRLLRDLWREWRRADGHEEIATPSADAPAPTTDAEVSNV